jgi:aryl-alcohol dehydrogenase-like predicted oxidoreductase
MSSESTLISRRKLIQAGVATGALAALPAAIRMAVAAESSGAVITRPIPSSGERIPVMGIGTNRFGTSDYDEVKSVLEVMHRMGGRVIDTAAVYGRSEEVIGKALGESNLRDAMFIATKFNAAGVGRDPVSGLASFERSLERLQMKRVDLMFAHSISSVEPTMPVLIDLKKTGRVRYIGITSVQRAQHPQVMKYMRELPIDFIQIDYSLGNRAAATDVFPLAVERKIAVMLAVPFGGGRNSLFDVVGDREPPKWAEEFGATTWAEIFLKYAVSHPAVTCAIPGSTKVKHITENQRAGHGALPDAAMRKRVEDFWDRMA